MTNTLLPASLLFPSDALIAKQVPLGPVPGTAGILAHQATDVFQLWQAWETETGKQQDIPYWSTVWPAALMMIRFLERNPEVVAGKSVLDLGCGGGVVGIAAIKSGAVEVIANDIDAMALAMAERNALANTVQMTISHSNLLVTQASPTSQVILVADLFYEKSVAAPMIHWLREARKKGALVLIADASRPFAPTKKVNVLAEQKYPTNVDLEGTGERIVRVLELQA